MQGQYIFTCRGVLPFRVCVDRGCAPRCALLIRQSKSRTYIISGSIIDFFYTQIIGDPTNLPVIKASANFPTSTTFGLLDGNRYGANGLAWPSTNVFFRQVRNLIFDTTAIPAGSNAVGIHWPSSQATAITNVIFRLSQATGNQHVGLFIEDGSGGLLNDLIFYGGIVGAKFGNQQYTARNLTFYNAQTAISQLWDWGWTYKSINVINCKTGIEMVDANTASITLIDSYFSGVQTAIKTVRNPPTSQPRTAGSLVIENVVFNQVQTILVGPQGIILQGNSAGQTTNAGFAMVCLTKHILIIC
jgi:glucan 1,3-beta-glucosidase